MFVKLIGVIWLIAIFAIAFRKSPYSSLRYTISERFLDAITYGVIAPLVVALALIFPLAMIFC